MKNRIVLLIALTIIVFSRAGCNSEGNEPVPGAMDIPAYKPLIYGKNIAIVANQTSMVGRRHLVDTILSISLDVSRVVQIFAPEHGFRDMYDAGAEINNGRDNESGLPVISLYGNHFKPTREEMRGIEIIIFDIQDVGARFYTYISTLHYVMESCAENNVKCIVLDRPDPNGFYFDGNIPDTSHKSFVGMHQVPIVHGMTIGEYARMINGEGWLKGGIKCDLTVIKCKNYDHKSYYNLPVKPSPNLPNQTAVYLYPSLCLFEGTVISCGRGTQFPFQVFGDPKLPDRGFSFVPESVPGAKYPPYMGIRCYGTDLRNAIKDKLVPFPSINLDWVIRAYNEYPEKDKFFNSYFDVLAGGPVLREQIQKGMTSDQIRATWKDGLEKFGKIRNKYLLYK